MWERQHVLVVACPFSVWRSSDPSYPEPLDLRAMFIMLRNVVNMFVYILLVQK